MLSGTIRIFLAEAILFPTGLITAAFLTRELGPEGYGLLTLAATIVTWIEWCTSSIFFRTTIKFISEAKDWLPIGATVLQQHVLISGAATCLLCFLAMPIAKLMGESSLAIYLQLFALQILFFNAARAHRTILTGLGKYSEGAITGASRWIARMILMILLVKLGFSVTGAILGSVGAALVELIIARFYIRPPLFYRSSFPVNQLWNHAVPMTLYAFSMHLYNKQDLMLLKILGGTAQEAGVYGAAQNLALVPSIFALSFAPVLLSTLGQTRRNQEIEQAQKLSQRAMRLVLLILPFAAMTAGAAPGIVGLIFGSQFLPAGPLLAILIFAAFAQLMISVATAILTAADKPRWTFAITGPLLPLAIVGHWLLIPKMGAIGAAISTTLFATLGAIVAIICVYYVWHVIPPFFTICRSLAVCIITYYLTAYWQSIDFWLPLKLLAITLLIPSIFLILGEFTKIEIVQVLSKVPLPFIQKLLTGIKL
jgi:O-antigen/teichoic acid export membrane protein